MLKMLITEAVVSKGYDGAPAIRFYDTEGGGQIANFRIGKRVYDSKAEDKHRWLNFSVKTFGDVSERVKRMKLKEGSYINLVARYDEETWQDKETGEQKSAAVLILEEVEFSGGGSGQKTNQSSNGSAQNTGAAGQSAPEQEQQGQTTPPSDPMPDNFTGFTDFGGGGNPFF